MENQMLYILKIIYYFVFIFVTYFVIIKRKNDIEKEGLSIEQKDKKRRIGIIAIIFLCLVIGYYGIICGPNPPKLDRYNYAYRFERESQAEIVKQNSIGLYYIESFLHLFTYNADILFFAMAFIYYFLTFKAYNSYEKAEPLAILLLLLSSYGLFGFYMLKQCMAIVLIAISFAFFFKNKKLYCIIYVILALLFHESAWIVVPLYATLFGSKSKWVRILLYGVLIISLVFFNQISANLIKVFSFIPQVEGQVSDYLNEEGGIEATNNILTILKGLPYYIITYVGFIKRKKLVDKIDNYDKFLMLSTFCSIATMMSYYMYWMWRFAAYTYFPVFIFASLIHANLEIKKEKDSFALILCGVFFALMLKLLIQYYYIYGGIV